MKNIDISIIIISFNTKEITLNCLRSIDKFTSGLNYEIIVVDNDSQDGSVKAIKEYSLKNKNLRLIESEENLGFGKANNLAAKNAHGKYLLFLNSDTIFTENSLKYFLDNYSEDKNLGVYSSQLKNADMSLQPSGGFFPNLLNVYAWQLFIDDLPFVNRFIRSFHPSPATYSQHNKPDWVTGAFMIVPKKIYDEIGGFDKNIFMYTEEMELAYRLSKLNKYVVYDPTTSLIHLGSASGGSYLALTSEVKYLIYFWHKHRPGWQLLPLKIALFLGSLLRLIIFGIIKNDEKRRKAYTTILRELV